MKAALKGLVALVLIIAFAVAALAIWVSQINPNDYKGTLNEQLSKNSPLPVAVEGNLGWSLFPNLAISVERLVVKEAAQPTNNLATLQDIRIGVQLMPLLQKTIITNELSVGGGVIQLRQNPDGSGNWQTTSAPATSDQKPASASTPATDTPSTAGDSTADALSLDVQRIALNNIDITYTDVNNETISVNGFQLQIDDLNLSGQAFPLDIKAHIQQANNLSVETHAKGMLTLNGLEQFAVTDLIIDSQLQGDVTDQKPLPVKTTITANGNLSTQQFNADSIQLVIDSLTTDLKLQISTAGETPDISGTLQVQAQKIDSLMKKLGQESALEGVKPPSQFSLSANIKQQGDKTQLEALRLKVDDTQINGSASLTQGELPLWQLQLAGSSIDLNRYLIATEATAEKTTPKTASADTALSTQATPAAQENTQPLIPVEAFRGKKAKVNITFDSIKHEKNTLKNIELALLLNDGWLKIKRVYAEAFNGSIETSGSVNARIDTPEVLVRLNLDGIDLHSAAASTINNPPLSGRLNAKGQVKTQGNSIAVMKQGLTGQLGFSINQLELKNINIEQQLCRAVAKLRKKDAPESWPKNSTFSATKGQFTIVDGKVTTKQLAATTGDLKVSGDGIIDIANQTYDYVLGLDLLARETPSCPVIKDKWRDITWPMRCQGDIAKGDISCKPDQDRLLKIASKMLENKAKEKLQEKLEEKLDPKLKDALKQLFKKPGS